MTLGATVATQDVCASAAQDSHACLEAKVLVEQLAPGVGDIASDLICQICQLHVVGCEPKMTTCSHLFCGDCIAKWLEVHPSCQSWATRMKSGGVVPCPVCKEPLRADRDLYPVCAGGPGGSGMLWEFLAATKIVCVKHPSCTPGGTCGWEGTYGNYQEHVRAGCPQPLERPYPAESASEASVEATGEEAPSKQSPPVEEPLDETAMCPGSDEREEEPIFYDHDDLDEEPVEDEPPVELAVQDQCGTRAARVASEELEQQPEEQLLAAVSPAEADHVALSDAECEAVEEHGRVEANLALEAELAASADVEPEAGDEQEGDLCADGEMGDPLEQWTPEELAQWKAVMTKQWQAYQVEQWQQHAQMAYARQVAQWKLAQQAAMAEQPPGQRVGKPGKQPKHCVGGPSLLTSGYAPSLPVDEKALAARPKQRKQQPQSQQPQQPPSKEQQPHVEGRAEEWLHAQWQVDAYRAQWQLQQQRQQEWQIRHGRQSRGVHTESQWQQTWGGESAYGHGPSAWELQDRYEL